jgi:hypothetical protein
MRDILDVQSKPARTKGCGVGLPLSIMLLLLIAFCILTLAQQLQ